MKETVDDLLGKTFIKLRSDYGFKRTFCSPEHADVLRNFLNALFEGRMVITDITFQDKEVLPPDQSGKRIIYDAHCTTSTGYHFVVEMQQEPSEMFGKRMVFYISSCVYRQGESGGSYRFDPVYLIVITDFNMKPLDHRLVNEVVLMERNTHTVYTEDMKIFFLSLAQVSKEWNNCKTDLERRLYLIKNMEKLNKESEPYKTGEYADMFNASEIALMSAEDVVTYKNSIMYEMERESAIEYAKEEGREEGIEIGMLNVARRMKDRGVSEEDIMIFTGLSSHQIKNL